MRGRKPKQQSRAVEMRAKLAAWKLMPESSRLSLRKIARELGTSHQLLSHYLQGWQKWQAKEYRRQAAEIRARAEMENRPLTPWEQQKARVYDQEAFQQMIESALEKAMRHLERDTDTGRLNRAQVKMLRFLASRGYAKAQKILEKLTGTERSENNLPLSKRHASKSFRSVEGVAGNSSKILRRVRIEIIGGDHAK